jgi:phage-related protein
LNDAKNNIVDTFLSLGDKLRPVFIDMLKVFNGAFDIIGNIASKIDFGAIYNTIKKIGEGVVNFIMPIVRPIGNLFFSIWDGLKLIWATISQFSGQGGSILAMLQNAIIFVIQAVQYLWEKWSKFAAAVVDIWHTIYVILEKIGAIWLIGKIFEALWATIKAIAGFMVNIYNTVIKPIVEAISWAYEKLKGLLGIKDVTVTSNVRQRI